MTFLLAVLGAVLLIALLSVFLLWRRETRRDGDRASWSGLALPLLVVVLGGLGYLTLGYHPETAQWLSDRRELSDAARRVIQGQPPEIDNNNLSAAAFARVLQSEVVREHQTMDGWYALGLLYDQLGAPAQAEEAARRALFLEPDNDAARLLLARSLIQANEGRLTDAAEAEIQKVLEAYPQHDGAWMLQAMAASRAHRYELALRSWQALLARHGEGEAGDLLRQGKANTERQLAKARQLDDLRITVNAGDVAAGGTLFVFLRQGEQGGQPLAARRVLVERFPATVVLRREDWLQSYPADLSDLRAGARYTPAPGSSVDEAGLRVAPEPLRGSPLQAELTLGQ